jgi:3-methyladenine DNA glycosylase AlkD
MVPSFDEIRAFCESHADPAIVQKYSRFFTEGYDAWGITEALLNKQRDAWLGDLDPARDRDAAWRLCDQLVATGKYEEGVIAFHFTLALLDDLTPGEFDHVAGWFEEGGLRNWAHVDIFCRDVFGPWLVRTGEPLARIKSWREESCKWKRRAAGVTCVYLIGERPIDTLLTFVEPFLAEPEKPVQQGAGWFLKDAWQRFPEEVESFLLPRVPEAGTNTLQIAREKMPKEKRTLYLKKRGKK